MPKIIINADDFGMNPEVNKEIINFIKNKLITSTSIIPNGGAFDDAISFAKSNNQISYGIHLNMTEFKPLTRMVKDSKFVNNYGDFNGNFDKLVTLSDSNLVIQEWSAQMERLLDFGIAISHIDSHHHVHTRPEVFIAIKKLQRKYKINKIRTTRNITPKSPESSFSRSRKAFIKKLWHYSLVWCPPFSLTTDYFGSVWDFFHYQKEVLPDFWTNKTIELMCHPGNNHSHIFLKECNILPTLLNNEISFKIELISYNDL